MIIRLSRLHLFAIVVLVLALAATSAWAQDGRGNGRGQGQNQGRGQSEQGARGNRIERMREAPPPRAMEAQRSEEHTSELQSLMRISYAVFCLKNKNK